MLPFASVRALCAELLRALQPVSRVPPPGPRSIVPSTNCPTSDLWSCIIHLEICNALQIVDIQQCHTGRVQELVNRIAVIHWPVWLVPIPSTDTLLFRSLDLAAQSGSLRRVESSILHSSKLRRESGARDRTHISCDVAECRT